MYEVEILIEHKLNCVDGRVRARDLADIGFLAQNYADHFSVAQAERLRRVLNEPRDLEQRYEEAFKLDDLGILDAQSAVLLVWEGLERVNRLHPPKPGQLAGEG